MAWEWPGYFWYQGINPIYAWFYDFEKYGCQLKHVVATFSKGTEAYYFVRQEYLAAGAKFFKLVKANPALIFKVLKKTNQAAEKIFALGKKWQKTDFTKFTDRQILAAHKILFKLDEQLWRNGQIPNLLELSNNLLSQQVKLLIEKKYGAGKVNELFSLITTSNYYSKTERQDEDFLKLLKAKNLRGLKSHWLKYRWMTYGWAGPELKYEYFLQNYQEALKDKNVIKAIEEKLLEKKSILIKQQASLKTFDPKNEIFLTMLRQIMETKAKRVDAHSLTYFIAEKMMREIGLRTGLSLNQMRMVIPTDVPKLFKQVDVDAINREYNRVLIWFDRPTTKKYTGEAAEKKLAYILKRLPKIPDSKELKGELAYPGKVRGRARVILDLQQSADFKKGEILVTRMTDPNYVPIMKLAKAVITDIGGITCHAAIVSRELRKPCLVGTQFATKVLKDGDLIEVDASRGIIKKLSRF